jgi:xylan 1,4-beta-xylosidase
VRLLSSSAVAFTWSEVEQDMLKSTFSWIQYCGLAAILSGGSCQLCAAQVAESFPVAIEVDAARIAGPVKPIWRFFGADEPNYAYLTNGRKLLGELGQLGKPQVYFRAHHLLTSGDGAYALKFGSTSAYKEDAQGNPVYDWTINDRIFDAYLACGVKPYVQLGFMPEALSAKPGNYPHEPPRDRMVSVRGGYTFPPKDYAKWGDLAYEWARHCRQRYGLDEVNQWYWEVWNEPNIQYWSGTAEDYYRLYDYAVAGVRRALPNARVGGPETAGGPGGKFLANFLAHCARGTNYATGKTGSPLDFVSFHAKGSPVFTDNHVRMGMKNQLQNVRDAFAVVASFPEYRRLPIVIGECDPEGCAACREPRDAYRNGAMYSSYTAASFPRILELSSQAGVHLEGALTWAFTFEDQPPFAGFRQLASAGLDLPVLNVFRMFGKMRGNQVSVRSSAAIDAAYILANNVRGKADVGGYAALDRDELTVLAWHYHDDDVGGPAAAITLTLQGVPFAGKNLKMTHYRIDADHSNAYECWKKLGSPRTLTDAQFNQLEQAGKLTTLGKPGSVPIAAGKATVEFNLPRQGVSLLEFTPDSEADRIPAGRRDDGNVKQ